MTADKIRSFRSAIYSYYRIHGRDLPWRRTRDPYRIFVSEMMLQQTQVERVVPKYRQFIRVFPRFSALAAAPLQTVLKEWQGLGYNRRAISLRESARRIVSEYGGKLPACRETLRQFPGIGEATAGEIAAFAFGLPEVFIETNIRSVFLYFFFKKGRKVSDRDILPLIGQTLDRRDPRKWYYALMDYGVKLKKEQPYLSQMSVHYRKQPPFKGSSRQLRGRLVRLLTQQGGITKRALCSRFPDTPPEKIEACVRGLVAEGFLSLKKNRYSIPAD